MHKKHKNPQLREHLYDKARAITEHEYDVAIQRMRDVDPGAVEWLELHAPKENWCEYYFTGNRYGHITSNIAESINAWLLDARESKSLRCWNRFVINGWISSVNVMSLIQMSKEF